VRFGAYHIYVPPLLKPAARALASLLWAEKQDNVDLSVLSGAQHMAGSGRTSFPIDKALPRDAYRVLGYKQCGERAVRVDILERLAARIPPALAARGASPRGAAGRPPSSAARSGGRRRAPPAGDRRERFSPGPGARPALGGRSPRHCRRSR